jgi:hypothetical protein
MYLRSLLTIALTNRRNMTIVTVGVDDVIVNVCVEHGHMGDYMSTTMTRPTCTSWRIVLGILLASVEVLTISL